MAKKIVLVTGGLGYLGGRLAHFLKGAGYEVIIGTRSIPKFLSLWAEGIAIRTVNYQDVDSCRSACEEVSVVIHLAAPNEIVCGKDIPTAIEGTVTATAHMAQAASELGVERFFYMSTAHVYGSPMAGTLTEDLLTAPSHPIVFATKQPKILF
jgi:UDP-glucose 4-epimerase